MNDLWSALCLVAVLEGLLLFAAPRGWKRTATLMLSLPDRQLRAIGGIVLALGLLALYIVRSA